MTPLRLAVFTNKFPGYPTTYFARDMRALIEAGIEVDVFAIYPHEERLWAYVPEILNEAVFPRDRAHHLTLGQSLLAALDPRRLHRAPRFLRDTATLAASAARFGIMPLAKTLYVAPLAWAWSAEFASRYDHVMAYWGNYPGTCAYLFHRLADRRIPFTLCVHAQIDLYEDPVYLEQKLLYADNVVTICEYNRRFIEQHYPATYARIADRMQVNYRGLDLRDFPYRADGRSTRRILAVGRLSPEKGYDNLLRSVAELVARGVDVELEIAGEGPEGDALTALADRLRIRDRVTFRGWLLSDDLHRAMHEATLMAQPSLIEGLPTTVEEAMALGTPIVGSSVGGIPELLDQGRAGMLVPPGDVSALTDALQTMLMDSELRRTFAERARKRAEEMLDMWRNGAVLADLLRHTTVRDQAVPSTTALPAVSYAEHS